MCTDFEINRYKIDEFRKTCKNRMFYLTSRDAKTVRRTDSYVMAGRIFLIDILIRNNLQPTRSLHDFRCKSYGSKSGFNVFDDL